VDWTEPWLLGLLGFHITTAVAVVLLRNHHYAQACILALLGRRRRELLNLETVLPLQNAVAVITVLTILIAFSAERLDGSYH